MEQLFLSGRQGLSDVGEGRVCPTAAQWREHQCAYSSKKANFRELLGNRAVGPIPRGEARLGIRQDRTERTAKWHLKLNTITGSAWVTLLFHCSLLHSFAPERGQLANRNTLTSLLMDVLSSAMPPEVRRQSLHFNQGPQSMLQLFGRQRNWKIKLYKTVNDIKITLINIRVIFGHYRNAMTHIKKHKCQDEPFLDQLGICTHLTFCFCSKCGQRFMLNAVANAGEELRLHPAE